MSWTAPNGRVFSFRLKLGDVIRIRENGTDLLSPETLKTFFADSLAIVELMAEATRPQWEALAVTYLEFNDWLIEGDESFIAARKAFTNGLEDFFRRIGQPPMADLIRKAADAADATQQMMAKKINGAKVSQLIETGLLKASADLDAKLNSEIDRLKTGS